MRTIEIAGPTTFYVMKAFSQTPVNPDKLPEWIRVRPDLTRRGSAPDREAARDRRTRRSGGRRGRVGVQGRAHAAAARSYGADDGFAEISGRGARRRTVVHAKRKIKAARQSQCSRRMRREKFSAARVVIDKQVSIGGRPMHGDRHLPEAGEYFRAARPGDRRRSCRISCSTGSSRSTRPTRCTSP